MSACETEKRDQSRSEHLPHAGTTHLPAFKAAVDSGLGGERMPDIQQQTSSPAVAWWAYAQNPDASFLRFFRASGKDR